MDDSDAVAELGKRLDYIEQYLEHVGRVTGYRYSPYRSGSGMPPEVIDLLRRGKQNDAIKLYRQLTDASLAQASEAIAAALANGL